MKPRKEVKSGSAGTPLLQESGYTISHEYIVVTADDLRDLKQKLDAAPDREKYGRYRARLFYGNLRRWQRQGLHFLYVSGVGTQECTCGLVLHENGEADQEKAVFVSDVIQEKFSEIELEKIQLVKGHMSLPSLKVPTVALIVNFIFKESINDYLWNAICQECGEYLVQARDSEAKLFVKEHNKGCGPKKLKKEGK